MGVKGAVDAAKSPGDSESRQRKEAPGASSPGRGAGLSCRCMAATQSQEDRGSSANLRTTGTL